MSTIQRAAVIGLCALSIACAAVAVLVVIGAAGDE